MADDSVVDDNESKIVTKFFLDTCSLLQPSVHHVLAAQWYANLMTTHPSDDDEVNVIPLITGSVAEFYIQPMLSCVGDVDMMAHRTDILAIPDGYPPPTQLPAEFHNRAKVVKIINSEYPGYVYLVWVYLLTENSDVDKHELMPVRDNRFLCIPRKSSRHVAQSVRHGPAQTSRVMYGKVTISLDDVHCVRCLAWPTQAADWPTRYRNYDWPDSATVDLVVSNGCDVVQVAHRLCEKDKWKGKYQYRLSFSRAEIVLLNSWMPVQQIVYHMLRFFVKAERLTDKTDSTGTMLSNYHIKTLMLWACELRPRSWWIDDLNVVRVCVVLLHTLVDWLKNKSVLHYFVQKCSLVDITLHVDIIIRRLKAINESWLSSWFVNKYLRKCAQLCPDRVTRLFGDISTNVKLQNAVFGVVQWRTDNVVSDLWKLCKDAVIIFSGYLYCDRLMARSCVYCINVLSKIASCLPAYVIAAAFLHVAYKITRNGMTDYLIDDLTTTLRQFLVNRHHSNQFSSILSLSQAAKLMKVVANNSRSTVQLIEIELSKAYLYRAFRCKDSDSDSIYCLANVYLAVLYYTTGHYQTAIDHCTLVMRSQDHSQCSSHVVRGELLPKIDDDIDTVLGLSVFYQYVRTAALNHQQTQHVSVFAIQIFACYLQDKCSSVMKCRQFNSERQRFVNYCLNMEQPYIADVLLLQLAKVSVAKIYCNKRPSEHSEKSTINTSELNASELVELLQQCAVEHLTIYRQLEEQNFSSVTTIVTRDFEALYAYKLGDYQRCLQLSTQNVRKLRCGGVLPFVLLFPQFIQLFDDDIVSLTSLTHIAEPPQWRPSAVNVDNMCITQLTLSLYLMTQCQLKLHHSVTSLPQILDYIEVAHTRHRVGRTLDHLTLKLTERKIMIRLASIMHY